MSVQSRSVQLTPVFLIGQANLHNVVSLVRVHLSFTKGFLDCLDLVCRGHTDDAHNFHPVIHESVQTVLDQIQLTLNLGVDAVIQQFFGIFIVGPIVLIELVEVNLCSSGCLVSSEP